jgi:hypothetical protein
MPPIPVFRDSGGTPLTANFSLPSSGAATPGVPSAAVELQLYNDTGADPLIGVLVGQFRNAGDPTFVTSGTDWADRHYVQIRITGAVGGASVTPTGWQPLGSDAVVEVPELAATEGIVFEVRIDAPGDSQDPTEEVAIGFDPRGHQPAPGSGDVVGVGVLTGLGDTRQTYIAQILADVVENPGGADLDVQVPTRVWIGSGEVFADHEELLTFSAASSGNERLDLIVLEDDGSTTIVAGPVETAPATTEATAPANSSPIALVRVDDSGIITDAEITQRWLPELGLYALDQTPSYPSVGLSGGRALVDSSIVVSIAASLVNLTDNETNSIWLQRDGSMAITTDGVAPTPRSLLLWEIVTTTSIQSVVDRRHLLGFDSVELVFRFEGALAGGEKRSALLVCGRPARLLPLSPVVAAIDVLSTDATGGQSRFGIKADDAAGGALASIMESGLSEPEIAFDSATSRSTDAIPATMTFPPLTLFEVEHFQELTGETDDPDGATVVLRFAV